MRETKFRVRDKKNDRWVSPNVVLDYSGLLLWSFGGSHDLIENPEIYDVQFFTGLHDKNGKEIFEGDVIQTKFIISKNPPCGQIKFKEGCFVIEWVNNEENLNNILHIHARDSEIIGNIYGDKDLLT